MTDAFYEPNGESRFVSTKWTRGPWDPNSQHGGPPAALLGRAVERAAGPGGQVSNVRFDILRPVPVTSLEVSTRVVRPGRKVQLVEATLSAEGTEVMRASAWLIRIEEGAAPGSPVDAPPPGPGEPEDTALFETGYEDYLHAMEWRMSAGGFLETGPAIAWMRMRIPLIADEEVAPLTRILIAADSASGISAELDFSEWLFVNPDLSVYLNRLPSGEWVCLDARTRLEGHGIGLTSATLSDENGVIGRSLQSLFVERGR